MSKTWIEKTPYLEALTKAKNKKVWQGGIFTDDNGDVFIQFLSFQEKNGEIQNELRSTPKRVLGKNIGRSNETSALAQAKLELASKLEKQRVTKGYAEEGEVAIALGPRSMLAHNYKAHFRRLKFPCYGQPKFDGFRMHQDRDNAWSRGNKPFIQKVIQHVTLGELLGDLTVDGELQYPGDFNLTQSLATKYYEGSFDSPGSADLFYYIYDLMDETLPFMHRWKKLEQWFENLKYSGEVFMNVELAPTWVINNEAELQERYEWCVAEGYEGLILRNATGMYDCGNRSYDLLKFKPEEDAEFIVVDIIDGRGSDEGAAMFRCETKDGLLFVARPAWKIPFRKQKFAEFQRGEWDPRGQHVTVKYYELTKTGVPRHPVAKNLRDFDLQGR